MDLVHLVVNNPEMFKKGDLIKSESHLMKITGRDSAMVYIRKAYWWDKLWLKIRFFEFYTEFHVQNATTIAWHTIEKFSNFDEAHEFMELIKTWKTPLNYVLRIKKKLRIGWI